MPQFQAPNQRLRPQMKPRDYAQYPFIVIWEVTRACALKCLHCRAEAQYRADPRQLTTEQGKRLIDDIAALEEQPLFVFTGGDPLMRPDLFELADYAIREKGLPVSMTPSATPKVTQAAITRAKEVGLSRWAFSLDGSTAEIHDHFRGTRGSYEMTMRGITFLQQADIPIQINTTVSRYNLHDLEAISRKVKEMGVVLWSLFFLIPTGRAQEKDMITGEEHEQVMKWMVQLADEMPYGVKSTEAPHYRRVMMQQRTAGYPADGASVFAKRKDMLGRAPQGVNDGDGFVFISHTGDVYPSGFLPVVCGNVKDESLMEVYRNSTVMQTLRDKSKLKGKCGVCEYKTLCGGSRARAYAMTGDYMASDPACAYIPAALR
ncbi:TIGR04053 family radical SAM/SPASM domain-containing protein [Paenibacillus sp. TSA_86.1]|uniref:TIGR04053 family radical SAM/SPASM domain-containing protein n=1 Tax=Paenibacillus sp. TSA_86.1 TaxID=3415649 RepID=UPI004045C0AC